MNNEEVRQIGERATDINIENKAREIAKEAIKIALSESTDKELVKKMGKEVAKEALFEIVNSGKDRRFQNTKLLMENYKILKEHIKGAKEGIDIKYEFRDGDSLVSIKSDYIWLESVAKSKARTIEMIEYVDAKLKFLIYEWESKDQREVIDSFMMFYIDDKTDDEIREKYNCGQNTPGRWRNKIISELSVLLWGIDAIKM